MKRVTIAFDDEALYRTIKVEAARSGRTTKEIVVEALRDWLERKTRPTPEEGEQRRRALELAEQVSKMVGPGVLPDPAALIRMERQKRTRQILRASLGTSTPKTPQSRTALNGRR